MTLEPVLVQMTRDGVVESIHRGHAVLIDKVGSIEKEFGNAQEIIYPRSAIKLAQATAMLRAGAKLENESLAISCASHSGEELHRNLVEKMLLNVGLNLNDLQNMRFPGMPRLKIIQISKRSESFRTQLLFSQKNDSLC